MVTFNPPMTPPTLEDLAAAQAQLDRLEEAWERYDGNNPDKYRGSMRQARLRVEALTHALQAAGVLSLNEHEALQRRLDDAFPGRKPGLVVTFEGRQYTCRFMVAGTSRSGKTRTWVHTWVETPCP